MDLEAARAFAHELADVADAITLPAFRALRARGSGAPEVERKDDGSPVTSADRDAERAMRAVIRSRFPHHAVLGEEGGLHGREDAPTWILDPIDGTKNHVRGIPVFATLIALAVDGRGVAAVISAPALRGRWDAVSGGPARHDGEEIRVTSTDRLDAAHVTFGGLNYFHRNWSLDMVTELAARTARQRGFGDFWQHCLVASGGVDVAMEAAVNRWDLAAPKVLVEAAGGRLTDLDGNDTDDGGSALASNGHLHEAVLEVIAATTPA